MFVVIFLILVAFLLFGGYLGGLIDKDTLQALGWTITIVAGIAAILQFVIPLATTFDPNFSFEPPEGITGVDLSWQGVGLGGHWMGMALVYCGRHWRARRVVLGVICLRTIFPPPADSPYNTMDNEL